MKMKRYILLVFAGLTWGCSDFLAEKSLTEIRPTKVEDMEKLLEGEAYFTGSEGPLFNAETDIFTDDWKSNKLNPNSKHVDLKFKDWYHFTWDPLMFEVAGGGLDLRFWTVPYSRIKGCNVILEYMDQMEGDEELRCHVLGEAYTLRGFYYLYLVNFFGMPYNYGDPAEHRGVPLKLVSGVTDEKLKRHSVAACYEQIKSDLLQGAELMKRGKARASALKTRLSYLAAYGLLSRVSLYMEDWDNAARYADSVLMENTALVDMKVANAKGVYNSGYSTEILWAGFCTWFSNGQSFRYPYTPSDELVRLYTEDVDGDVKDKRGYTPSINNTGTCVYIQSGKEVVRNPNGTIAYTDQFASFVCKSNGVDASSGVTPLNGGIRTAELYLNRAEACIRRYMTNGNIEDARRALVDLNTLRRSRFADGYIDKEIGDFASDEELLAFCLRERRRELCGEGNHRWFDLRRLGMPEIKHVFIDEDTGYGTEYVLNQEDPRYALPIPEEVLERNFELR